MSVIQPLPAIRYATTPAGRDVSTRIAPPYDVLDLAGKNTLVERDERNFVRIDLPHVPAKDAGPPAVYSAARDLLAGWLADGTLVRDQTPAIYVYHQAYEYAGQRYLRKKFFARLRLEEFGAGSVYPHEQTFGGPKEDRMKLTEATRCNLSPIFGIYEDPQNRVSARLESALPTNPILEGTLDGMQNRVWAVTDAAVIADVAAAMREKATYIADGHHRYGTSLMYRRELEAKSGKLAENHPAQFILSVFCAMEDAGLLILPTHRVLPGRPLPFSTLKADPKLDIQPIPGATAQNIVAKLAAFGPQAVALFDAGEKAYVAVRPRDPKLLDALEPTHSQAWRALALAFLHAYLIPHVVKLTTTNAGPGDIHYVKGDAPAIDEATQTAGSAFLLQATTMAELRDVCKAGDLMPQKSTFFYPKLASGLIVNPLEP